MIDGPDIDSVHIRTRGRCSKSGSLVGGDAPGCHASQDEDIELWLLAAVVDRLWVRRPNIVPLQPLVGLCQRKSTAIRLDVHLVGWNASFPGYRRA